MIRKILVPVRGDGKGDNVLAHAAVLARRFSALIEVAHCRPRPEDMMPFGVPIPESLRKQLVEQSYRLADLEEQGLRDELGALAESLGLDDSGARVGEVPSVSFIEEVGRQVDVIKRHGRLSDLIAVAQPDRDRNIGTNTLKAALFHSGRPVLMCPDAKTAPATLGERVALAWNGSAESARALAQSMRILVDAETVSILSSGADAGPGTSAEEVVAYLGLYGVKAEVSPFAADRNAGKALLRASDQIGADLLVMGAYGDSHERETLFGGNTQTVVDTAAMPVLFSH